MKGAFISFWNSVNYLWEFSLITADSSILSWKIDRSWWHVKASEKTLWCWKPSDTISMTLSHQPFLLLKFLIEPVDFPIIFNSACEVFHFSFCWKWFNMNLMLHIYHVKIFYFIYLIKQVATIAWFEADSVCGSHSIAIPSVLVLPYLFRFFQCLRQYKDTQEKATLMNGKISW